MGASSPGSLLKNGLLVVFLAIGAFGGLGIRRRLARSQAHGGRWMVVGISVYAVGCIPAWQLWESLRPAVTAEEEVLRLSCFLLYLPLSVVGGYCIGRGTGHAGARK